MNFTSLRLRFVLPMLAVALAMSGCNPSPPSPPSLPAPVEPRRWAQNEKVTLISETGDVALVQAGNGDRMYVSLGLLKHRDTSKRPAGETYTHTLVREAPVSPASPVQPLEPPPPRRMEEIDQEQLTLNGVFLTEQSRKLVIAPRNVGKFVVDEETGQRAWHAYQCDNPACPGEKLAGFNHHVFIHVTGDSQGHIICPACTAGRDLASATREQVQQWGRMVHPCELPETVRRRKELDAERRQAIEAMRGGATGVP